MDHPSTARLAGETGMAAVDGSPQSRRSKAGQPFKLAAQFSAHGAGVVLNGAVLAHGVRLRRRPAYPGCATRYAGAMPSSSTAAVAAAALSRRCTRLPRPERSARLCPSAKQRTNCSMRSTTSGENGFCIVNKERDRQSLSNTIFAVTGHLRLRYSFLQCN